MNRIEREKYFMQIAVAISKMSTFGAVLVKDKCFISGCFNKNNLSALQNAIINAAKVGIAIDGCDVYMTYPSLNNEINILKAINCRSVYYIKDDKIVHVNMSIDR